MSIVLQSSGGGSITINEPATASNFTQTLPAATGEVVVTGANSAIVSGTAVASTSGTSIDFTGIPSWVKRVTVMLRSCSFTGTTNFLMQIGSGSFTTSGYTSTCNNGAGISTTTTSGYLITVSTSSSDSTDGFTTINLLGSNTWVQNGVINSGGVTRLSAGSVALSGTLDRVRITSTGGTDTFDAGSINILYE
jgi:hypothetical protein